MWSYFIEGLVAGSVLGWMARMGWVSMIGYGRERADKVEEELT